MHFFSAKKRPKIPIFSIFNTFVQKHRNELRGYLSQWVAFQLPNSIGLFLTEYEGFRNFSFDRWILDIYRQPLLNDKRELARI